jgi:hypothetical protein
MNNNLSLPYYTQTPEVQTKSYVENTVTVGAYWIMCLGSTEKALRCGSVILSISALAVRTASACKFSKFCCVTFEGYLELGRVLAVLMLSEIEVA